MALRSISLCAGIGGIDLGLARWARSICYVEREAYAASVLVARMGDSLLDPAPVWSDLRTFDAGAWRGCVDLVTAGYPCQPFSVAGKQLGEADERHLWPEVLRIVRDCEAPLVFLENVAGHLRLGFDRVLSDLADLGFDAEWRCVRASDVGAPHRRERLFVLAYRDGWGRGLERIGGLLDGERATLGHDADGRDADVADALRERRQQVAGSTSRDEEAHGRARRDEREQDCDHIAERAGETLADAAHDHGRRGERGEETGTWPPGPADAEGWKRWIEQGGPVPAVRRDADGIPNRMDRLRCLGNAVVPAQAEAAFEHLLERALQ